MAVRHLVGISGTISSEYMLSWTNALLNEEKSQELRNLVHTDSKGSAKINKHIKWIINKHSPRKALPGWKESWRCYPIERMFVVEESLRVETIIQAGPPVQLIMHKPCDIAMPNAIAPSRRSGGRWVPSQKRNRERTCCNSVQQWTRLHDWRSISWPNYQESTDLIWNSHPDCVCQQSSQKLVLISEA